MKVTATGVVIGSLVATFIVLSAACSNNGEGDRCDFDNGNDDCQDGLVCVPATAQGNRGAGYGTVNAPYNTSDRCCPLPRSSATHPACVVVPGSSVTDSGANTSDASVVDGASDASDASDDGSSDASSDAISDAPSDG